MSEFIAIPVRDGNGDELVVYIFRDKRGARLCSGEPVHKLDARTFAVSATGELLTRLAGG